MNRSDLMRSGLVALLALIGCSSSAEPNGWRRVIGVVQPFMSSIQAVIVPPAVSVNVPFAVTVNTVGSSSCTRPNGATLAVAGNTAVITPYDFVAPPGTACTEDLHAFPRSVNVTFTSVGVGRIQVKSRSFAGDTATFELELQVRGQ
jgi:hypothetical protein